MERYSDPYAALRESLVLYRTVTAERTEAMWCRACGVHSADDSGLCPLCVPDRADLAA